MVTVQTVQKQKHTKRGILPLASQQQRRLWVPFQPRVWGLGRDVASLQYVWLPFTVHTLGHIVCLNVKVDGCCLCALALRWLGHLRLKITNVTRDQIMQFIYLFKKRRETWFMEKPKYTSKCWYFCQNWLSWPGAFYVRSKVSLHATSLIWGCLRWDVAIIACSECTNCRLRFSIYFCKPLFLGTNIRATWKE